MQEIKDYANLPTSSRTIIILHYFFRTAQPTFPLFKRERASETLNFFLTCTHLAKKVKSILSLFDCLLLLLLELKKAAFLLILSYYEKFIAFSLHAQMYVLLQKAITQQVKRKQFF
jgi:hypothetical protein